MTLDPKDFFDWIKQQPDDRPVNMNQNLIVHEGCGCLLVQYGKHLNLRFDWCGFDTIGLIRFKTGNIKVLPFIVDAINNDITTFKEAKKLYDNTIA